MSSFSTVQVSPDPSRHGPFYYTSSWSFLDFLDAGRFVIDEKNHIDQDSVPILEEIISLTHQLKEDYKYRFQLDQNTLGKIIDLLKKIEQENDPILIFYPQIAATKATSTFQKQQVEEQKRIQEAQEEAKKKAQDYKEKAASLLTLLTKSAQPGQGPSDKEVIEHLNTFSKLCEGAVYEQKGSLAKGLSVISKKILEGIEKMREIYLQQKDSSKPQGVISGHHPLVELLTLLSNGSFSLGVDKKVTDALSRLEQYHERFQGVKQFIRERVPSPSSDLTALRRALHFFLMKSFIHKMNPQEYLDQAYLHLYSLACRLVDNPLSPHASEKTEWEWIIKGIHPRDALEKNAIAIVQNECAYHEALMAFYTTAAPFREANPPSMRAQDSEKLKWAENNLDNTALKSSCASQITAAKKLKDKRKNDQEVDSAKKRLKIAWSIEHGVDLKINDQALKDAQELCKSLNGQVQEQNVLLAQIDRPSSIEEEGLKSFNLDRHSRDRDWVRKVMRARGEIKSSYEIDLDLLDFYERAKQARMDQAPDAQAEEGHKIEWAKEVIEGKIPCKNENLSSLIREIREDLHDHFIAILIHLHGTLRRDEGALKINEEKDKLKWGQEEIKKCFSALFQPGDSSALKGAELVWMAIAHSQQLEELYQIRAQVMKYEASPSIDTILQNLRGVIRALRMQPDLIGTDQTKKIEKEIAEPILNWITISHQFCLQKKQNAIEQKEVDALFEPIAQDIRAERYLEGFEKLEVLLKNEESIVTELLKKTNQDHLEHLEEAFDLFLQKSPPQQLSEAQKAILNTFGTGATILSKEILSKGVEDQRKKMVSNILVLVGYKLLENIFKGLNQSYEAYRTAVDEIAGETEDYDTKRIGKAIDIIAGSDVTPEEKAHLTARIIHSIEIEKGRLQNPLNSRETKERLHQKTYQGLLSVLITANTKEHTLESYVARGFLPLLLWVVDLFIDPFSKTLIKKFTDDVILESNGQLKELHLKPLEAVNEGLATYNSHVQNWPKIVGQNAVNPTKSSKDHQEVNGAQQQTDLPKMLNHSRAYQGLTPSKVDQKGLYMCVDTYLYVTHLCQDVQGLFDQIHKKLWEKSYDSLFLNGFAFGIKGILSFIPYTYGWGSFLVLKTSELLINFSLRQIAKFAIWYTQAGTSIMMQALNTTITSPSYVAALDKILLEKLKDLERDLERNVKLAKKKSSKTSSVNDQPIRAFLSHVKTTLSAIQCDTSNDVQRHLGDCSPWLTPLDGVATTYMKDIFAPSIIETVESFLSQESMLLALYSGLELANKGIRAETNGNQGVNEKIQDLKGEMTKTLNKILETAIYPRVDKVIDDFGKGSGQVVSETISWLEKVLYDDNNTRQEESIFQKLSQNLEKLDQEDSHNQTLNEMYEDYSHFIKTFREHEEDLKKYQSYNGILLTRDVLNVIAEPLRHLTKALAEVIENPCNPTKKEALKKTIQSMQTTAAANRSFLNDIKQSETTSHAEQRRGILGKTLGSWETLVSSLKEKMKAPLHNMLDESGQRLAENGKNIFKNTALMQHLIRSVIASYLKV